MRPALLRRMAALLSCFLALVSCGGGHNGTVTLPPPLPGSGGTSQPQALPVLPEVASVNGVAQLSLEAKFDANGRPAFFFNGAQGAPTIRVQPGDAIRLHLQNALPQYCGIGVVSNSNLHFHGLSSAPVQPGDEVIATNAAPGGAVDYVVRINPDQPPGLYWYHPHPHGLSSYEVGNGMAGAIVVEGIASEVPRTAGLRERVIVLGDVPNDPSFAAGEAARRRAVMAARRRARGDDENGNACGPEDGTPTINGLHLATIGIKPGETQLWRIVNASGHRHFDLAVDGAPMTLVAQDGVPLHDYPGGPESVQMNDVVLAPAARAEVLVTGPKNPAALVSKCFDSGPGGDPSPEAVLGVLTDDGGASSAATATARVRAAGALRRSRFYRTALPAPAVQRTIHFSEDGNGFYLDGKAYDPAGPPSIVAQSGTVEEWTLENDSEEIHAFHIHQVHFVVESVNGVAQANPHWLDTVDIPPQGHGNGGQIHPAQIKVLIDFRDPTVRGTFLYHCHILDHEDGGMMAKIEVR
jgi:suppressor of ftsI